MGSEAIREPKIRLSLSSYVPRKSGTRLGATFTAVVFGAAVLSGCDIGGSGNDNTAAKFLPDTTQAFVSVALSPSVQQKTQLFQLSRKFPASVQSKDEDSLITDAINDLIKDQGLTYDADIKSWLGAEAAAAVLAPSAAGQDPIVVALLSVRNQDKAAKAVIKANVKTQDFRFVDDYLVLAHSETESQAKALDTVVAASDKKAKHLSDNPRYAKSIAALKGEHLVLGYADVPALARTAVSLDPEEGDFAEGFWSGFGASTGVSESSVDDQKNKDQLLEQTDKLGPISFSIYATTDSVVVEGVTNAVDSSGINANNHLLKSLPTDTLAAFGISKLGDQLTKALDENNPESYLSQLLVDDPSLRDQLKTPAVAAALSLARSFDGEVTISAGDVSGDDPEVGLLAQTSKGADAKAALDKVIASAKSNGLSVSDTTIAGSPGYAIVRPDDVYASDDFFGPSADFFGSTAPGSDSLGAFDSSSYAFGMPADPSDAVAVVALHNDTLVVASTKAYAEKLLLGGDNLGASAPYAKAVGDPKRDTAGTVYVNLDALNKWFNQDSGATQDPEEQAWFNALGSFGFTSSTDGDTAHIEARLSFK